MLYLCQFTWYPGTTRQKVAQRVVAQHEAAADHRERIRGWYNLVGGGGGLLIVDYDDPRLLADFLQPYMDLMKWDVRAITPDDYEICISEMRRMTDSE